MTIYWQIPDKLKNKNINLFFEANIAFDYNYYYKKGTKKGSPGYNDVNGQPSLVWNSSFNLSNKFVSKVPKIIGHGHVLGKDHEIDKDISKITTAKNLFGQINFIYSPGNKKIK